MNNGCYAETGPLRIHWDKVSSGERGISLDALCKHISDLSYGTLWRHNQAGDVNEYDLFRIAETQAGTKGFTYTHNYHSDTMQSQILLSNSVGFTVNLSANNLDHADQLYDLGIGPVVSVVNSDYQHNVHGNVTPKGRKVVVCPAVQLDHVNCANCGLCQKANRDYIIAFPSHGTGKRKANEACK